MLLISFLENGMIMQKENKRILKSIYHIGTKFIRNLQFCL